jgi:sigma-54-specific transcriptional regulator
VLSADAIRHAMTPEFTRTRVPASHRDGETEPLRRTPAADGASSAASPAESALERALLGLFEAGTSDLFDRIEGEIVSAAYRFCHRNQVQTARLLGLSRNIVRARLIKIGELEGDSRSRARANALSNT